MNNHCRLWRRGAAHGLYLEVSGEETAGTEGASAGEPALRGLEESWSIAGLRYADADRRYGAANLHVQEVAFKVAIGETRDEDGAHCEESEPQAFGGDGQRHTDFEHQG